MAKQPDPTPAVSSDDFDARYPEVWLLFSEFARKLRNAGNTEGSPRAIMDRVRWHYLVHPERSGAFKIPASIAPIYAARLVREDPSFAGFFTEGFFTNA